MMQYWKVFILDVNIVTVNEVKSRFLAEFGKKRFTDHDFPPPLKMWGRKIIKSSSPNIISALISGAK